MLKIIVTDKRRVSNMISPVTIILCIMLAIIIFTVQIFLLKKSENKVVHFIPFFFIITALFIAYIMSLMDVKGIIVKCGSLMPTVRIIKDAVTVCMVSDAAAMMINKMKKEN